MNSIPIMQIQLIGIRKAFDGKEVIHPTDMTIEDRSFTSLLGPSGCGKTTLLRMIAGLETPDEGEILFGSRTVFSASQGISMPPERRGLGFVFQDFALWPHLTVRENVAFGLRAAKRTEGLDAKVRDALHQVKLDDYISYYPSQLSGGQQQRVAFARAIVTEPECILFDEPLSALDAMLREEMRTELRELAGKLGITSVFVTHDQHEAMSMSTRIALISKGSIEQYDTPENVYAHPATAFAAHFIGASNWIDDRTMFRPEEASLSAIDGAEEFLAKVTGSEYMGSGYIIHLEYSQRRWTMESRTKAESGSMLPIYIKPERIVRL